MLRAVSNRVVLATAIAIGVAGFVCPSSSAGEPKILTMHQLQPQSLLGMSTETLKHEMPLTYGCWTMIPDSAEWELDGGFETHKIHLVLRDGKVFAMRETWQSGILPTRKSAWKAVDGKDHPELQDFLDPAKPLVASYQDGFETTVYLNTVKSVAKKWHSMHPGVQVLITYRTSGPPEFMKKCGNERIDQEALDLVKASFPKPLDHNVPVWGFTVDLQ
jgi:hypothetical protein